MDRFVTIVIGLGERIGIISTDARESRGIITVPEENLKPCLCQHLELRHTLRSTDDLS